MSDLDRVIHQAKGANRDFASEAGHRIGEELSKHNAQVKKKREQRYHETLGEISKYHLDRAITNRTYH